METEILTDTTAFGLLVPQALKANDNGTQIELI